MIPMFYMHFYDFSIGIHSTINANARLEFVYWHLLLFGFDGDAMGCGVVGQLETVSNLHIAADCSRTVLLLHFAGKRPVVNQQK